MLSKSSQRFILINSFLLGMTNSYASSTSPSVINIQIGTISTNYNENKDNLKPSDSSNTNKTSPYTGSASSMPLSISYEYFSNLNRAYFGRISGPIMGSTPDRYYSLAGGINFYFGHFGSKAIINDVGFKMKIQPKLRYYVGPHLGAGYLVFNTKSATKADVLFELGAQAGIHYALNEKWSLTSELGYSRAVGALTSANVMKILIGTSFSVNIFDKNN